MIERIVLKIEKRIEEAENEIKYSHSQEDVWIKQGVRNELISLKKEIESEILRDEK